MKILCLNILLIFSTISCNFITEKNSVEKENVIISKIKLKKNSSEIDTLWVSQNDTTVYKKEEVMIHRPCSNPEFSIRYELINPKVNSYYFIYNEQQQLVLEGKYTKEYTYEGATEKLGNFYNSKSYSYKSNGKLKAIHYMEDGRNSKLELYDRKKSLKEIIYYDKKSSDKTKIEIYDNGQLEETRIYTSFDNYYIEKANN